VLVVLGVRDYQIQLTIQDQNLGTWDLGLETWDLPEQPTSHLSKPSF